MKNLGTVILCLALSADAIQAQQDQNANTAPAPPPPSTAQITSSGANFNLWQWQTYEILGNGQVATHTHSVTELASGLNYADPNTRKWVPSQETIQPYE
jgi:hypothetical protein